MHHTHTFACPQCGRRMGVGPDQAGRPVRCPHCMQVVVAPAGVGAAPRPVPAPAADPYHPPPPDFPPPAIDPPPRERAESIFADPGEADDAVFAAAPIAVQRVQLPDAPPEPPPADPRPERTEPAPPPADPWAKLHEPPAPIPPAAPPVVPAADPVAHRLWLAVVALAAYATAATVLAVWGWLR